MATGDLHLNSSATQAIDQASVLASITDDYDGALRPYGLAPDIGADEYGTQSTEPPIDFDKWIYLPITIR